jgi:hypothetical protein
MLTPCVRFAHATLQGRLPQEFGLAGITAMAAANRFLAETFIPEHNRRFREAPAETLSAFVPWAGRNLDDILCVQQERTVGNDCRYGTRRVNTVRYEKRILQIPPDQHRHHDVKCKVRVHAYLTIPQFLLL